MWVSSVLAYAAIFYRLSQAWLFIFDRYDDPCMQLLNDFYVFLPQNFGNNIHLFVADLRDVVPKL